MIYVLDNNENIQGVLAIDSPDAIPFYDDAFTENVNGSKELSFSVPVKPRTGETYSLADYIVIENLLIYKTREGTLHLMRIIEVTEENQDRLIIKKVVAENSAIGDLSRHIVEPTEKDIEGNTLITSYNIVDALDYILADTDWGYRAEYSSTDTFEFVFDKYENAYTYLKKLSQVVRLELNFIVKLDGLVILGGSYNTTFYYGVDLTDVTRELDSKDIITTLIPVGKSDEKNERVTLETKTLTDTVDPIFANDFVIEGNKLYSKWALNRWGKGKHRVGFYENNEVTDANLLLAFAQQELNNRIYPKVTYSMKLITYKELSNLEDKKTVYLGDDVLIIDSTFNPELRIKARVVEKTTSENAPANDDIVLGNVVEVVQDPAVVLKEVQRTVNYGDGRWDTGVSQSVKQTDLFVQSIRGGNRVLGTNIELVEGFQNLDLSTNLYTFNVGTAEEFNQLTDVNLPKNIDKRLEIILTADIKGNVYIEGFTGAGEIVVKMNGYHIEGHVYFMRNSCRCGISSTTGWINGYTRGSSYGYATGDGMVIIYGCPEFTAYGLNVTTQTTGTTYGIYIMQSNALIQSCDIHNFTNAIYCRNSNVYIENCTGTTNSYGVTGIQGGVISSSNTIPNGTVSGTNINATVTTKGTFTPTVGTGTPVASTTKTVFFYPTDSDTGKFNWGTTGGVWLNGTDVIQGSWYDKDHQFIGFWFFGTQISDIIGGATSVQSMRLYLNRKATSGYSNLDISLVTHEATSKAGTITIVAESIGALPQAERDFARGESKWVDLTSFIPYFKTPYSGKGLGLYANNNLNEDYAVFFQDCIVEITYVP